MIIQAVLGPLGAKIQSLPASDGSLGQRWKDAKEEYDLFLAIGDGHVICAFGWFSYLLVEILAALTIWTLANHIQLPHRMVVLILAIPCVITFTGVVWSALRHLTRGMFARWDWGDTPVLIDDIVILILGCMLAYLVSV